MSPFTIESFQVSKINQRKISMLTAYDYSTAKLLDAAGVDTILVGDSLGMTMLGYGDTLSVTMDDMIHHTKAVCRGVKNAFVIGDMPFLSYHTGTKDAVINAGRLIQEAGAKAVKLERGQEVIDKVDAIIKAQIPVIGHLGLTPQSVNVFGGFKVQGRNEEQVKKLIDDALLLEETGVFGIVLEGIPEPLAKLITERLTIPTIGIGAGRYCDGQVLVIQDVLGMHSGLTPRFVKQYANIGDQIIETVKAYIDDVQAITFPEEKHTYQMNQETIGKFQNYRSTSSPEKK